MLSIGEMPGVPDVGPKTALQWIQKYGSLDNLYEHVDEIKGKRGDNLREFKDQAFLSKKLVTIRCDVPVDIDYENFAIKDFDKDKLAEVFGELGFSRLLTQLGLGQIEQGGIPAQVAGGPASAKTVDHKYELIDTGEKLRRFSCVIYYH